MECRKYALVSGCDFSVGHKLDIKLICSAKIKHYERMEFKHAEMMELLQPDFSMTKKRFVISLNLVKYLEKILSVKKQIYKGNEIIHAFTVNYADFC